MKNDTEYKAEIQNFPGKVYFILPAFGKYRIAQNFDSGKVWRNLTNKAFQKVWQAKLWRIELGFVRAGKNKILWNYNVLARVENL